VIHTRSDAERRDEGRNMTTESNRMAFVDLNDVAAVEERGAGPVALNPNHQSRQEAARVACESIGITWPETILPPGTALYESGVEKLTSDRKKMARLPNAADAVPAIQAALASEDRRDFRVQEHDLRLDAKTAKVVRKSDLGKKPGLGYSEEAFAQFCARIPELSSDAPRGHAKNLLYLAQDLRAEHVNRMMQRSEVESTSAECLIRTKVTTNGQRVIRAVLSHKYADVSDVHVAEALAAALAGDARTAKLDYRPGDEHSQFEVVYPSEIPIPLFRVGDVHKAVILVENSETGQGSIRVRPGVVRARCANLTLSHGFGVEVSFRHLGNADRVKASLRAAIGQAAAQMEPLIQTIVTSTTVEAPKKSPGDLFAAIAKRFDTTQATATTWKETYESKYLPQYGANLWSVTSAITDAAQGAGSWWEQQAQEEVAGALLAKQWAVLTEKRA
jgi:hypothetical protein